MNFLVFSFYDSAIGLRSDGLMYVLSYEKKVEFCKIVGSSPQNVLDNQVVF